MNLDQITNIAEIAASVATIVTLAYLAVQISKNNKLQQAESRRSLMNHSAQLSTTIGQSNETSEIFYKGLIEYRSLSPSERMQFEFLFSVLGSQSELAHTDWRLGLSDKDSFESCTRQFLEMLKTPGGHAYWRKYGKNSSSPFYQYVIEHAFDGNVPNKENGAKPP